VITPVVHSSEVGEARRAASEFAHKAGANAAQLGRIALVATEMATNIVKHAGAGGGALVLERFDDAAGAGVELLALDRGPGMADVKACFADGFSTAGSPGTGLGAIVRQADLFGIYSRPGLGTALSARFVFTPPTMNSPATDIGVVNAPYPGESVCGDKWAFDAGRNGNTLLVVDGSGHGVYAAEAAGIATGIFSEHAAEECVPLVERLHRGLAPSRGAALAVARIDTGAGLVRFVGVGNIAAAMVTGSDTRQMISHNGTAGHIAPRIREFTYPFTAPPTVILHSDGLTNRWKLADYPGLGACHPSLIAAVLFRDFRRGRDDATVAVMRPR
jgi:anti-sigma regulatory factor (Ser/Thr protein kinase)